MQTIRGPSVVEHRLDGLDSAAVQHVVAAAEMLALGRGAAADAELTQTRSRYPEHAEVLRLQAGVLNLRGDYAGAIGAARRAVASRPLDALYRNTLAATLANSGNIDDAIPELIRACELAPGSSTVWYNLGVILMRCVRVTEAERALRCCIALSPKHAQGRILLAKVLRIRGNVDGAAAEYRRVLRERPWAGMAWWGLADLRISALTPDDVPSMHAALRNSRASDDDQIATGFALARVLDEAGQYSESLDALARAHAIARRRQQWDAGAFIASIDASTAAFTPPLRCTAERTLGHEAIFIVGMPRSGTTLTEQILASHSAVEGSGELPALPRVVAEESRGRREAFPRWVRDLRTADWQRMGDRYMQLTARWRQHKPHFTDKLPSNWMYIGIIRAMLPGAHIVACRRDPLETCFSCYRQYLFDNEYTRTNTDLALFWRAFDRSINHWSTVHPRHVYQHGYERLQADPESSIRKLLSACGLQFEPSCVRFNETIREVSSPSATQVRRPLQLDTAHTQRYGALLNPLRGALGLPLVAL